MLPHPHSGFFSVKLPPPLLYPPSSSPSCRAPQSSAQLALLATAAANSLEPDLHSGAGERRREGGGTRRPPKSKLGGEDWAEGPPGARLGPARGGEGGGGGGRAQRTAKRAGHCQLHRFLPRFLPESPLPSSHRSEQHLLQTLDPHSWGRPAPSAPYNCLLSPTNPGTFSASTREWGLLCLGGFLQGFTGLGGCL